MVLISYVHSFIFLENTILCSSQQYKWSMFYILTWQLDWINDINVWEKQREIKNGESREIRTKLGTRHKRKTNIYTTMCRSHSTVLQSYSKPVVSILLKRQNITQKWNNKSGVSCRPVQIMLNGHKNNSIYP